LIVGIYWLEGGVNFFDDSIGLSINMEFGSLPLSYWIYVAIGMNGADSSFAVVRVRGEIPYKMTLGTSPALTTSSVFQGSGDASSFTVRGYTGLFSGRKAHG
jgi:hypothetical protein